MSISSQVLKIIEVMSQGGGKTSMVNINLLQETLKVLGWSVHEGTTAQRLTLDDQLKRFLSDWMRSSGCKDVWGYTGVKEPKEFWFDDPSKVENAKRSLPAERVGTKGPSRPQRGSLYYGSIGPIPQHDPNYPARSGFETQFWWLGVVSFTFTNPHGQSVTVAPTVDSRGQVADVTRMKLPRFWTWAYKNGLQEAAKKFMVSGGQDTLETERRERELSLRSLDNTGTCPCCFRNVKMLTSAAQISRHGWEVQGGGWRSYGGWHSSACVGTGYPPYELSKEGTVEYLKLVNKSKDKLTGQLRQLEGNPITVMRRQKPVVIRPDDPSYVYESRIRKQTIQRHLREVDDTIQDLEAKITTWKQQNLPGLSKKANRIYRIAQRISDSMSVLV